MFLGDIARAFSGLGSGLAHGIGGLGRRIKKFGEADDPPSFLSVKPSFDSTQNPGEKARQGLRVIEDSVAAAESGAREDYGLPDLPISRRDLPITAPIPTPTAAPSFSGLTRQPTTLPDLDPLRRGTPTASGSPSMSPAMERGGPAAEMDSDRRNLPIPALPGHAGGPTTYNPADAAEYDYVMRGAKRDAEGNLLGKEEGGGFNRDWKQSALSTLAGAARGYATTGDVGGAIGGAAAGGAGSLISPAAGREFNFDTLYRPKMEADLERERVNKERANMEIFNQAKLDDLRATTEGRRAQAKKLGEPERRSVNRSIGINRRTGRREFFDASDPAQLALYDPEPLKNTTHAWGLGRNVKTGEIERYDAADPDQAADFEPYRFPTPERPEKQARPPRGFLTDLGKLRASKQNAQRLWKTWSQKPEGPEKEKARELAGAALATYNEAVGDFGVAYGDLYETGMGEGGWAYSKPREGRTPGAAPSARSQPAGERKAVVGADFVNHVANTLGITREEAVRRIKEDGYEVQ